MKIAKHLISTDMILEGGPYGCYDDYIVSGTGLRFRQWWCSDQQLSYRSDTNCYCYRSNNRQQLLGQIGVEDKIPPVIECRDVTIICGEQLPTVPAPEIFWSSGNRIQCE